MRPAAALAVVALLLGACAAPADEPDRSGPTGTPPVLTTRGCADLVVLGLRGSGQDLGKNHGSGQEILRSVRAMSADLHRTRRTSVRLEGVPYRAEFAPNATVYQDFIDDGVRRARERIEQLVDRCPHSHLAVVGFSLGAQAVHELVADLPASLADRVVVVAMIADPRRDPGDAIGSWTYGRDAPHAGKLGPGPPVPEAYRAATISFCATGDEICSWPPGGYSGPLSDTHRHFYETPAHARSTGHQLARIVRRQLG